MVAWRKKVKEGNRYFQQQIFDRAESSYIQACERAEKLFKNDYDADRVVTIMQISYQNLADSLRCQKRYRSALDVLVKLQQIFRERLELSSSNSTWQAALARGLEESSLELEDCRRAMLKF